MTKREFAKWTQARTREVAKSGRYGCTVAKNGTTVCVDTSTGKVGIARLHPDDDYVFETGVAIAYARCKGIEVPKINVYKKLSEMKNGERFVSMIGDIYRYIARDNDSFVVWNEKCKIYVAMPFDFYYEMVE